MNIHANIPSSVDEFLHWNEGREGKREFVRGRVVEMMVNVSKGHLRIATEVTHQLVSKLGTKNYDIGSADFGVKVAEGVRYPDVLVETFAANVKALATEQPIFIAEVLSPSTMAEDFGRKAEDYLGLNSLQHYLILSQDEILAWLWSRDEASGWSGPVIYDAQSESIALLGLEISLDLHALYRGIVSAS